MPVGANGFETLRGAHPKPLYQLATCLTSDASLQRRRNLFWPAALATAGRTFLFHVTPVMLWLTACPFQSLPPSRRPFPVGYAASQQSQWLEVPYPGLPAAPVHSRRCHAFCFPASLFFGFPTVSRAAVLGRQGCGTRHRPSPFFLSQNRLLSLRISAQPTRIV